MADGQAVVINFVTGMYYSTSTLGSAVLDNLIKGASPEDILATLKKEAGCPTDFDKQFTDFISELEEKEIILPTEELTTAPVVLTNAFKDGFALNLNEFAEVQDLLLADPVHDVEVDKGWPALKEK